ncbi:MAG: hypothetical protein ACJ8AD_20180 [Gemmatimonadaceae bacterium]
MPSKYDRRKDPEVQALAKKIPGLKHAPLVGAADLVEINKVFAGLPRLNFPINSAGEMIDQLDAADKRVKVEGIEVDPGRMIKYMPAYYFPVASMENFVEKMAELIRENRNKVNVPAELAGIKKTIKAQAPNFKYPIKSADDLLSAIGRGKFTFGGADVDTKKAAAQIPAHYFPITSETDFDAKMSALMLSQPLVVPH